MSDNLVLGSDMRDARVWAEIHFRTADLQGAILGAWH